MSLRAACFGDNVFERDSAGKCISNLLAVGYRRLSIDVYWTHKHRKWTLCPATIPFGPPTYSNSSGSLYQLGPYACSDGLDLASAVDVLLGYFEHTNSQVNVYTTYLILNLHAAASDSAPDQPAAALSGPEFPANTESVGTVLDQSLGTYIYRPSELANERSNLNNSWLQVDEKYRPIVQYITIHEDAKGRQSTPDGWPCSKYVQLAKQRRVLLGFGSIDPQLKGLNLSVDSNILFPPSYLTTHQKVTTTSDYTLKSGCLYRPEASQVSQINSSWAISNRIPIPDNPQSPYWLQQLSTMVVNQTSCGLSPFLNNTLLNSSAATDVTVYRNVSLSSSWAWATGEPGDSTQPAGDKGKNRCAVMDVSLAGHWRAANCSDVRRTACRVNEMPYTWTLSNTTAKYKDGSSACPDGTTFAVPRTGLENSYLFEHALSLPTNLIDPHSLDPTRREIFLDFNSLDIASCWVTGGPDAGCPYASDPQQLERKTVLVATIAGIVICIIAALTLFVKCNANRRNSRRMRRVIEGWEYEGVPS